jgi:hypothetical protein
MIPIWNIRGVLVRILALSAVISFAAALSAAEWKIETVDQSGSGRFTSMKVDKAGNVHVAYIPEAEGRPLKYAFWDHTLDRWFTMKIASSASFCSLVLDSKQRPHISYADDGTGKGAKLRYIYWEGAKWKSQPVSPIGDSIVAYYTSIALDANDNPSFSYYDYGGPGETGFTLRLRSVFWNGQFWEVHMVDRQPGSGKFNSIAIDSLGRPHIAYANVKAESAGLRYATWDGETWKTEILEGAGAVVPVYAVSMLLDKDNNPHIAYTDVVQRTIKYATRQNGRWELEVVDRINRESYPDRNGIALDSQGDPYISYYDPSIGFLKVAFRKNGKWYSEVLAGDFAGFTSSMQIHDGTLWVSFADDGGGALKVAHRTLDKPDASASAERVSATKAAAK